MATSRQGRQSGRQSSSKRKSSSSGRGPDVYALLKEDHQKVKGLFKEFEKLHQSEGDPEELQQLAQQICRELKVHTQLEEEQFYPALREVFEEQEQADLLNEAQVEHDSAKQLIEQIESGSVEDEMTAAQVTVLGEYVNHHIEEEEKEIFPAARKAKLDAAEIGESLAARKEELKAEMGELEGEEEEEAAPRRRPSAGGRGAARGNGAMRTGASR